MKALRVNAVVLFLAIAALGAGCGDEGGDDAPVADAPLPDALADVGVTGDAPASFTWVDTARLREVAGLGETTDEAIEDERWRNAVGLAVGLESLGPPSDLGFDPMAGERTITVGTPPDDATRYDGLDPEAVESTFEEMGFEPVESDGNDFLALGDEGELVESSVDELGVGPVGINRVLVEDDAFAFGAYEDAVVAALEPEEPLGDEPAFAAMSACLGDDVLAAAIRDPDEMAAAEVELSGVGILAPDAESVADVVCAVGSEGGSLDEVAARMEKAFTEGGLDPFTRQPYEDFLGPAEIESGESDGAPWVRATFETPEDAAHGTVFEADQKGALASPLGVAGP